MKKSSKEDKITIILAIVQLVVSFFTDYYIRKINIFNLTSAYDAIIFVTNKLIAFCVYIALWKIIFVLKNRIKSKDSKVCSFLQIFIIYFAINIILLIITWPGIWRFDECKILECVTQYRLEYWQHYLTSIFYNIALMLIPIPSGVIIVQIAVISCIVAYIISNFKELLKNKKLANILYIPFLLLPLLDTNLYPIRLSIYTYIELLLVCQLIFMANKEKITPKDILILLISLIILSVWRNEGILFLVLIPIICIFFLKKGIPKLSRRIGISLLTVIISIALIIPQEKSYKETTKNRYEFTSFVNQLQVVVRKDIENGQMSEETKEKINKVIDIDTFLKFDRGIYAHNNERMYNDYSPEEYKELKKIYQKLVLKYPTEVIKERLSLFLQTSGFKQNTNVHVDNTRIIYTRQTNLAMEEFRTKYATAKPISLEIRNSAINMLEGWNLNCYDNCETNIIFNIFYNVVPSMIVVFAACIISLIKRKWISFFTFGIILLKAVAIMLTAPDTFFMYYLPIYLVGYFTLILAIVLKIDKNKNVKILL